MPYDVVITGGLGRVGLPLGIAFARTGLSVCLHDVDKDKKRRIDEGQMPFMEDGAPEALAEVLASGRLATSMDPACIAETRNWIIALGTPVDEYLNPKTRAFLETVLRFRAHLDHRPLIVVRSTVYPRTCDQLQRALAQTGEGWRIAYCPERIVQGHALKELSGLPQIVSGNTPQAEEEAAALFKNLASTIVRSTMHEAELAKLFCNVHRYVQFAVANQFYMLSTRLGVDYERVRAVLSQGYPRASNLPGAGFAAGPCLLKDTMQLSAFAANQFPLGLAAMQVNEGMPNFIVDQLLARGSLVGKKVGILGMAFKANIDDPRDSLSYKLGKLLRFSGADVAYTDPYIEDRTFITPAELIERSEIIIVAAPHAVYKELQIPAGKEIVDVWSFFDR